MRRGGHVPASSFVHCLIARFGSKLGSGVDPYSDPNRAMSQWTKEDAGACLPQRISPAFNSEVAFHLFFALPITARTIPAPYYSPTASTFPIVFAASICAGVVTWV